MLHEPQLVSVLHGTEIEFDELLLLLLDVVTYIADESEDLGDYRVHFYFNVTMSEYFMASLKSSLIRRHQYDVNLLILEQFSCLFALLNTLRR